MSNSQSRYRTALRNVAMGKSPPAPHSPTTVAASAEVREWLGRSELNRLMRRRDGPALMMTAVHFGLLGMTGFLVYSAGGTGWAVPATILHGIVLVHLFSPYHECSHNTAFRTGWLNTALGWCTGLILMMPPLAFRYEHADHHTHTQNTERDPQMILGTTWRGYLWYASAIPYAINIARNLLLQPFGWVNQHTRRAVPAADRPRVQRQAIVFACVYLGVAGISLWIGSWAALTYWLFPRLLAEPFERVIRMTEHVGCAVNPQMLENSRTVLTNRAFMLLSWNMPHHTAHHAVPLVPFHQLPRLTELLGERIEHLERGYPPTLRKQWRAVWNSI